jgi:hypothetical protein
MNRESNNNISDWDSWDARKYLETYYDTPLGDTYETLDFLIEELKDYKENPFKKALEFGSGPTLFGALAAVPYVQELHLSDYLPRNLLEIRQWLACDKNAFAWDSCTEYILKKEGVEPTIANIAKRSDELRLKLKKLLPGDIAHTWPLLDHKDNYDLVVSLFCAESITSSKTKWRRYMKNLFSLVVPQGVVIISALRNCPFYRVGDQYFPCANINEEDLKEAILAANDKVDDIHIRVRDVMDCQNEGFVSVMFARVTLK